MKREEKNKKRPKPPVTKYLEWGGIDGVFTYWDAEKKKRIPVKEIEGSLLIERHGVRGWSKEFDARIFSTEVEDLTREKMKVFSFDNGRVVPIYEGSYIDGKSDIEALGGKYAKILYIKPVGLDEIWHLTLTGGALNWIDFARDKDLVNGGFKYTEKGEKKKKGVVTFWTPKWEWIKISEEEKAKADEYYKVMKEWWKLYKGWDEENVEDLEEKVEKKTREELENEDDGLPF